jgi:tetrahydromethanopterin S-methyltransferase subunit G
MELRKRAFGIAFGAVWGLVILFGTWFIVIKGTQGLMISKLSTFYIGYSSSFIGGIIGFLYGFVTGFIAGFLIAWIYNLANKMIFKQKT